MAYEFLKDLKEKRIKRELKELKKQCFFILFGGLGCCAFIKWCLDRNLYGLLGLTTAFILAITLLFIETE